MSPSTETVLADLAAEAAAETSPAVPPVTQTELLRDRPTPGYFYRIRKGDTLLAIAGRAYHVSAGTQARLDFARRINRHPLNRKFLRTQSASSLFPEGLISFFPRHSCDALALINSETPPGGGCFAVIYIPAREVLTHPVFGPLVDMPTSLVGARIAAIMQTAAPTLGRAVGMEDEPPEGLVVVPDTTRTPWRFICSVFATAPHPLSPHICFPWGPATGTLIGHRSVLTAAHVLHENYDVIFGEGRGTLRAERVFVVPAGDSAAKYRRLANEIKHPLDQMRLQTKPLGMFEARSYHYDKRHETPSKTSHLFDYAVIKTGRSIGGHAWKGGRYGYWNSHRFGDGTVLLPQRPRAAYQGRTVYLSGYPTDWSAYHGATQLFGRGRLDNDQLEPFRENTFEGRERIAYEINSQDGHSGAPVWRNVTSDGRTTRMLTAVHSRRLDGGTPSGVLITQPVYDQIVSWMRAP